MGAVDIGNLNAPVAIQVSRPDDCQPAMRAADIRGGGCEHEIRSAPAVDGKLCAELAVAARHDDLVRAIAVEIGEARGHVFEHMISVKRQRVTAEPAIARRIDPERFGLMLPPQHEMAVARDRIVEPGPGDGAIRVRIHRQAGRVSGLAGGIHRAGPGATGHKRPKRKGQRICQPPPHQICFSGMRTMSPSSSSVTFNWQVRRENSSGS